MLLHQISKSYNNNDHTHHHSVYRYTVTIKFYCYKKKCLQIKVIHSCSPSLSISPSFTQMYTKQLMPLAKLCNNYSCCSKYWIHTSVYVDQCLPQCITASDSFVVGGRRGLIAHGWPMCPWPRRSIPICLTTL